VSRTTIISSIKITKSKKHGTTIEAKGAAAQAMFNAMAAEVDKKNAKPLRKV